MENNRIDMKRHLREKRFRYIGGMMAFLLISLVTVMIPKISGTIVDRLELQTIDGPQILIFCLQILGLALATILCHFIARVLILKTINEYDRDNRNRIYQYLLKLSMRYYNQNSVGDIMAISSNDLRAIRMSMMRTIIMTGRGIFTLILSVIAMMQVASVKLALLVMIPFPILVLLTLKFGPMLRKKFRGVQDTYADMTSKTQENVTGIRVIKAFSQEDAEVHNFEAVNQRYFDDNRNMIRTSAAFHSVARVFIASSYLLLFAVGGSMVINGEISTGDYVASVQYIGNMIRPFMMIGMLVEMIQRGKASISRVNQFLAEAVDIPDDVDEANFTAKEGKSSIEGHIELRNLTFSYGEDLEPVLKDINLTLHPGQTLGIIGRIGSGKSTLGQLIMRLYQADRGMVRIDGYDIEDLPVDLLRRHIGYIPQHQFLFSDTIAENVAFSPGEVDMDRVMHSVKTAQIHDAVMAYDDGYDTKLGEKGVNLSGGQKQRLSIARALYRQPAILIVDDALSAVDTETEARILAELKPYSEAITTLIIAHRVSTIEHADQIIVMDDGRIVEQGTHEQLMTRQATYYDIYQRQQLENQIDGGDA